MKNHPDITGMMSKGDGKMDQDEEDMMSDIGMAGEFGGEIRDSNTKGRSSSKSSA